MQKLANDTDNIKVCNYSTLTRGYFDLLQMGYSTIYVQHARLYGVEL